MRILFVADIYSIHTVRWVNALAGRGHEVHLASLDPGRQLVHPVDQRVSIHYLGQYNKTAYIWAGFILKKIIQRIKPDIINAHYASSYGLTARIAGGRPLLLNVWGSDVYAFPYKNRLNRLTIRRNLRSADRIASTSGSMADQVRRLLDNPGLSVVITPFGVDAGRYAGMPVQSNEVDAIIIGLVKALKSVYGISCLIDAMPLLLARLQAVNAVLAGKIQLHIYGEGVLRPAIQEQIRRLRLDKVVFLKGCVSNDEVPAILNGMALYCLPSVRESFGVSAVEAMAAGLPVVATDTDGFRDILVPDQTGIIVPVNDARAMAEAMFRYCLDPDLRQRHGEAGRKRASALYNWNRNVDTMEAVYRDMAGQP